MNLVPFTFLTLNLLSNKDMLETTQRYWCPKIDTDLIYEQNSVYKKLMNRNSGNAHQVFDEMSTRLLWDEKQYRGRLPKLLGSLTYEWKSTYNFASKVTF